VVVGKTGRESLIQSNAGGLLQANARDEGVVGKIHFSDESKVVLGDDMR
jgi:hypothetical protein